MERLNFPEKKSPEKIKRFCPFSNGEVTEEGICLDLSCEHYGKQVVEVIKEKKGKLSPEDTLEIILSIPENITSKVGYFMSDIKTILKLHGLTPMAESVNSLSREQKDKIIDELAKNIKYLTKDMSIKDIEFFLSSVEKKLSLSVREHIFSRAEEDIPRVALSLPKNPEEKIEKIAADIIFKINPVLFVAKKDSAGREHDKKTRDRIISEEITKIINNATNDWPPYQVKNLLDELCKTEIFSGKKTEIQEAAVSILKKISEEKINYYKKVGIL